MPHKPDKSLKPVVFRTESNIQALRKSRSWSQIELAGRAKTNPDIVRKAERGEILNLSVGMMLRLASALECSVSDLFPILAPRLTKPRKSAEWRDSELHPDQVAIRKALLDHPLRLPDPQSGPAGPART